MQLKRLTAAFVFLATVVLVSAQTGFKPTWAAPKKASPAAALKGVWTMTSIGGEAVSPNDPPLKIEFRPGNSNVGDYLITRGTDEVEAGEFRLTETPAGLQVDFGPVMGENAGKIQLGIMKIEDAKLTWCMSPAGSEHRPTAFANAAPTAEAEGTTIIEAMNLSNPTSAPAKPALALKDAIFGTWNVYERNGVREPEGKYSIVHKFERPSKWTAYKNGAVMSEGWFMLDEISKPAKLTLAVVEKGSKTGQGIHGYVEADGNILRLNMSRSFDHLIGLEAGPEFKVYRDKAGNLTNQFHLLFREGTIPPPPTMTPPGPVSGSADTPNLAAALQGIWTVTSVGGRSRDPSRQPMTLAFEGQEFRIEDGGVVMFMGQWKLGADHNPMTIDLLLAGADRQPNGDLLQGLVEVNGATLRIAMGDPNTPRPKSFNSSKDTDGIDSSLMIAERR